MLFEQPTERRSQSAGNTEVITQSISNILISIFFLYFQKQIEIANQGIVLCCMCPGFTDTAFVQNLEDKIIDFPAAYQAIEKMGLLKYDFSSHERKKWKIKMMMIMMIMTAKIHFCFRVKTVVDGIMKLVADQKNGSLLKVTHNGTEYVTNTWIRGPTCIVCSLVCNCSLRSTCTSVCDPYIFRGNIFAFEAYVTEQVVKFGFQFNFEL